MRLAEIPARLFWLQINIEAAVKFAEPFSGDPPSVLNCYGVDSRSLFQAQTNEESMAIKSGRRELIDTGTDKRYVKRNPDGTFKESVDLADHLPRIGAANQNLWRNLDMAIRVINRSVQRSPLRRRVNELQKSKRCAYADFGGAYACHQS